jgi:3-oxoacyl-[acyl-carrier protein] reductase
MKRALITGSSRGIGKAVALELAARGYAVAVHYAGNEAAARETAAAAGELGSPLVTVHRADLSQTTAAGELVAAASQALGGLDVLVNNAGVTRDGLLMRMKEEDWNTVLDTNLKGAFNTVKAFQRVLMRAADPRIVNISSVIGLIGNPGQTNYAASKAGLIGFTKAVARELAGRKVTCNAVAPGFITTDMTEQLPEKLREDILSKIPLGEFGSVDDIASIVLYLASPAGRYITGQVIAVDGGMSMH